MPSTSPSNAVVSDISAVVELRQYRLHPQRREALIALFDGHFVDGQEASGIRVLGQFRDLDDPDRFVWLRGFRDLPARAEALAEFYGGPIWRAHREAANATMIDSDDVLQLRPVDGHAGLRSLRAGLVVVTIYELSAADGDDFARFFDAELAPMLTAVAMAPIARLVSEPAANNFPALPIRGDVRAFVWLAAFADAAEHARQAAALAASPAWSAVQSRLHAQLAAPPRTLRLQPTPRSRLGRGSVDGDVHDFDFLAGRWHVANRRLVAGASGQWEELAATSEVVQHLDGGANVEEIRFHSQGWAGLTVRTFERARRRWSIAWISSREGVMLPPVVGAFDGNRGVFAGEDSDGGRPIRVVFTWTKRGAAAARWEQAFSYDGGRSWQTNWIMDFTRIE